MNRAEAYEYAKAQSRARAQGLPPIDPRTFTMNNYNKARPANASVAANAAKLPANQNVRPNPPSDANLQNNRLNADILPPTANAALRSVSEAPPGPSTVGHNSSDIMNMASASSIDSEAPHTPSSADQRSSEPAITAIALDTDSEALHPPFTGNRANGTFQPHDMESSGSSDISRRRLSGGEGLTDIQRKAVISLLKGTSISDTAQLCGVEEWTLRAWLRIPEVDELYAIGRQQNIDSLTATIQAAALKAAATLIRLSESDNPSIQTRAAKALVQLANTAKTAAQKAQVAAEVAKARQEDLTVELNQIKTSLGAGAKNWEKIRTSLVHGTFRRPGWLPRESWERIINANYAVSAAW